jgi:hypothetical protein
MLARHNTVALLVIKSAGRMLRSPVYSTLLLFSHAHSCREVVCRTREAVRHSCSHGSTSDPQKCFRMIPHLEMPSTAQYQEKKR